MPQFLLKSTAFDNGGRIPRKYTCDGKDISPPLFWTGVPEKAASLALLVNDPDAPRGDWVHWVLFDMPGSRRELPELTQGEAEREVVRVLRGLSEPRPVARESSAVPVSRAQGTRGENPMTVHAGRNDP